MAEAETYICDLCNTQVGADRVHVLTAQGQVARHPDCHEFGEPRH